MRSQIRPITHYCFYTHKLTANSTGSITFTTNNSNSLTTDWSSTLYQDTNCNQKLDGAEGTTQVAGNLPTTAGQMICLINKVYAPANVANGETYSNMISADFNFSQ